MSKADDKAVEAFREVLKVLGKADPEYRPWILAWALGGQMRRDGERVFEHFMFGLKGCLGIEESEYESSYPMKAQKMVSMIKGARKFAKVGEHSGGVGKSANAISPGAKPRKKRKKK